MPLVKKPAWKAKHPKGDYSAYVKAYNRQKSAGLRLPSTEQLMGKLYRSNYIQQARGLLDTQYKSGLTALQGERDRARADATARAQALQGAYGAAGAKIPQVAGTYTDAGQGIVGASGALTGQALGATQASQADVNQRLAAIGAQGVDMGAPQQAQVEQYRGGYLPGAGLAAQGAIEQQRANSLAATTELRGGQEAQVLLNRTLSETNQNYMQQLRELNAGRYEALPTLMSTLSEQDRARTGAILEYRQFQQEQAAAQADLKFKYAELRSAAQTAAQKAEVDKWYKEQQIALGSRRADISQQNANTSRQNAITSSRRAAAYIKNQQSSGKLNPWKKDIYNAAQKELGPNVLIRPPRAQVAARLRARWPGRKGFIKQLLDSYYGAGGGGGSTGPTLNPNETPD